MSKITSMKATIEQALKDPKKPWTQYLTMAEKSTGVDRLYIFLGSIVLLAFYLVLGIGQQLVCNVIAFLYPAYCSMKALESPHKEDDTKWLTYWVIHALFTIVEFFSDMIVSWFPVYWLMKILFYVWLMIPTDYNGSLILYNKVIRPRFLQYHPNIEQFLATAKDHAVKAASSVLSAEKQE